MSLHVRILFVAIVVCTLGPAAAGGLERQGWPPGTDGQFSPSPSAAAQLNLQPPLEIRPRSTEPSSQPTRVLIEPKAQLTSNEALLTAYNHASGGTQTGPGGNP